VPAEKSSRPRGQIFVTDQTRRTVPSTSRMKRSVRRGGCAAITCSAAAMAAFTRAINAFTRA
jgi:hypothetical protein